MNGYDNNITIEKSDSGIITTKFTIRIDPKNISSYILTKKEIYQHLFHETPNYVKVPRWMYRSMIQETVSLKNGKVLLCGLEICPTNSINSIAEIEVF